MLELLLYGFVGSILKLIITILIFLLLVKLFMKEEIISFRRILRIIFVSGLVWWFLSGINPILWIIWLAICVFFMFRHSLKPDTKKTIIYTIWWLVISILWNLFLSQLLSPVLWVFFPNVTKMETVFTNISDQTWENNYISTGSSLESSSIENTGNVDNIQPVLSTLSADKHQTETDTYNNELNAEMMIVNFTWWSSSDSCDILKGGDVAQFNHCISYLAQVKLDSSLCKQILLTKDQEACELSIKHQLLIQAIKKHISQPTTGSVRLMDQPTTASTTNSCDNLKATNIDDFNSCIISLAQSEMDFEICKKTTSAGKAQECKYEYFLQDTKKIESLFTWWSASDSCDFLKDEKNPHYNWAEYQVCLPNLAKATKDSTVCGKADNTNYCLQQING